MPIIPTVIERNHDGERHYDIFSLLLQERIILLNGEIDDNIAAITIAQILYLGAKDSRRDIQLYINSPGGSITAGMAIYDTMKNVLCPVSTICVGLCASMAAFLLSGGTKGKRYALPHSEIMIHQPLGGAQGQVTDIEIVAKRMLSLRDRLNDLLAHNTGQSRKVIDHDTERDYFMTPDEAKRYGLIDEVINPSNESR